MKKNNWYVITGGPSSGKTTLIEQLQKLGFQTFPEAARVVIDKALKNGITPEELRADENKFQDEVLRMKGRTERSHDPSIITFFDRGIHDSLAYARHYGFEIKDWMEKLFDSSTYQKVFLLEPLGIFEKDYARTESEGFHEKIHPLLHTAYSEYGMVPTIVRSMSIEDRIIFILNHIKERQPA